MNPERTVGPRISRYRYYPIAPTEHSYQVDARTCRARWTGEIRPPRKGEWFLSGAVPEAYEACWDHERAYHIAQIIRGKLVWRPE